MPRIAVIGLGGWSVFMKVDHFHAPGETIHASSLHEEPGGKGYNQAIAAKKLGADVSFLYAIGQDERGKQCEAYLHQKQIRSKAVLCMDPTAYGVILTDAEGENQVTIFPGAQLPVKAVDLFSEEIKNADAVLLQQEVPASVNLRAIELALIYQKRIILNPAPPASYTNDLAGTPNLIIVPNEHEAQSLMLERFFSVVVTQGAKGVTVYDSGRWTSIPAPVVHAVDTTGAGDVFCAALTVRLCQGYSLMESAKFACHLASESTRYPCVMPAIECLPSP